jgi:hypothetical protein
VHIEDVPYQCDGMNMIGYLAFDDQRTGRRPAVLVSHEGSGLDQHAKGIAERRAARSVHPGWLGLQSGDVSWRRLSPAQATGRPVRPGYAECSWVFSSIRLYV